MSCTLVMAMRAGMRLIRIFCTETAFCGISHDACWSKM
jgi:hypothetical protein